MPHWPSLGSIATLSCKGAWQGTWLTLNSVSEAAREKGVKAVTNDIGFSIRAYACGETAKQFMSCINYSAAFHVLGVKVFVELKSGILWTFMLTFKFLGRKS